MIEIKVGTSTLSAQNLNTLTAKQAQPSEKQTCNLYQDTSRPLYRIDKPTLTNYDLQGNPAGSSYVSMYREHFDVTNSLKYPIDAKPKLQAEHIWADSLVMK
jgi:hypothetical protein